MIIDGHSHACGKYLTTENIRKSLSQSGIDKVVLVPGELDSTKEYSFPNIASVFPNKNVVKLTNSITKFVMKLTKKVKEIPPGNDYVHKLRLENNDQVIHFVVIRTSFLAQIHLMVEKTI